MRDCKSFGYQNHPYPPVQLHPLCLWSCISRSVSVSPASRPAQHNANIGFKSSAYELQEPCSTFYTPQNKSSLISRLDKMEALVREELTKQGFQESRIHT